MMEIKIREATFKDKNAVLKLLNEVFQVQQKTSSPGRNSDFWRWKYENNVFEKAVIHVVEVENEILACGTLWPFEFKYHNRIIKGYQPCDTVVSVKARGKGLFRMMNEERKLYARKNGADLIFNFPNSNSLPGYQKMGWSFLGKIQWQVRILQPLKILKNLSSKSQSKKMNIKEQYLLNLDVIRNSLHNSAEDDSLINLRTSIDYYLWRHMEHPTREYGMITFRKEDETAVAIFHLMKKDSVIEMVILDFISSKQLFRKLLRQVIKEAKNLEVSFIAFMKPSVFGKQNYLSMGFFPKKMKNFVCFPINSELGDDITKMKYWNLKATLHDSI